jgi:hypothetical protein
MDLACCFMLTSNIQPAALNEVKTSCKIMKRDLMKVYFH